MTKIKLCPDCGRMPKLYGDYRGDALECPWDDQCPDHAPGISSGNYSTYENAEIKWNEAVKEREDELNGE